MRRASSGSTTAFRNSTPSLRPPSAASSGGDHSGNYLQANLLVQDQERRNAENLSESVGISARAMQRFLTEARWSDETVIGRLQEYLAPRLGQPGGGVGCSMAATSPSRAKSGGSGPAYCGRLGKVANCQGGMFLAYVSPLGRALVDKRLYLPKSWTSDQDRCARVCRRTGGTTGQRRSWPWRCWSDGPVGLPQVPSGLPETTPSGCRRPSGRDWRPWGCATCSDVPGGTKPGLDQSGISRVRAPPQTQAAGWAAPDHGAALDEAWHGGPGKPGAAYRFNAQRVRATKRRKPGEELWAVWRRNLDGSEPRYYLSNAPEDTPLETLAYVGGSRWRIETEFETEKGDVGLDEYETRSWAGWHHHIAMCLLGGAFLLGLQQDWGEKDAPYHPPAGVPGGA